MHVVAPVAKSVSVTKPAPHNVQFEPPTLWYLPAMQLEHSATGVVENCPGAHAVHEVAPDAVRTSVTDPIGHSVQIDVDRAVKYPGLHCMQLMAPTNARVSVL